MFHHEQNPQLEKVDENLHKCPFCLKTGRYAELVAHLQGHQRSLVNYGGSHHWKNTVCLGKEEGPGRHLLDDQVDKALSFLASVFEMTQQATKPADQVAFVMDVLLPEATVHAIAATQSVSLDEAMKIYKHGTEYDWSEKQLMAYYLTKNLSEETKKKIEEYKEKLRRALESEEFLERL